MAEMSKWFKIVIIINAIVAFIFGLIFLVIPELYVELSDAPYTNPPLFRLFGATILLIGVFDLLAVKIAEWENVKIMIQFGILWLIAIDLLQLISFAYVPRSATNIASTLRVIIILTVLAVLDIYFYLKQE